MFLINSKPLWKHVYLLICVKNKILKYDLLKWYIEIESKTHDRQQTQETQKDSKMLINWPKSV